MCDVVKDETGLPQRGPGGELVRDVRRDPAASTEGPPRESAVLGAELTAGLVAERAAVHAAPVAIGGRKRLPAGGAGARHGRPVTRDAGETLPWPPTCVAASVGTAVAAHETIHASG
jgi:hypothetical protein